MINYYVSLFEAINRLEDALNNVKEIASTLVDNQMDGQIEDSSNDFVYVIDSINDVPDYDSIRVVFTVDSGESIHASEVYFTDRFDFMESILKNGVFLCRYHTAHDNYVRELKPIRVFQKSNFEFGVATNREDGLVINISLKRHKFN